MWYKRLLLSIIGKMKDSKNRRAGDASKRRSRLYKTAKGAGLSRPH